MCTIFFAVASAAVSTATASVSVQTAIRASLSDEGTFFIVFRAMNSAAFIAATFSLNPEIEEKSQTIDHQRLYF